MGNAVISIADANREQILHRMASGEPITAIAKDLGYADHSGIIHRLGDDPDYLAALQTGIVAKLEKREGELEAAQDNVTVTRADRLLGHTRWWAERLDPNRWGAKTEVRLATAPVLNITIVAQAPQIAVQHGVLIDQQSDPESK